VRYLRNALIAKVAGLGVDGADAAGVGAELLQVSPDEQKRAARTAALFGEEELTRFLQVMLRTFDELGYRQEQRFHFELGLMKLVHLRRLLPMEEVLSQVGGRAAAAGAGRVAGAGVSAARPVSAAPVAASAARPAFSPFEQDKRRRPEGMVAAAMSHGMTETRGATAVSVGPIAVARAAAESLPMAMPAAVRLPEAMAIVQPLREEEAVEAQRDIALPVEVFATTAVAADAGAMQRAVVEALAGARQQSAADAMEDAVWTLAEGEARVETGLTKTMLPMVMNAEAEKIALNVLRGAMGGMKLVLLPGAEAVSAVKKVRVARVGTAEARAKEHPVVQQAQRLFNAEIRNVIDLREGE
jgi:DNA polymerase-3 subunit gamma/tau